MSDQMGGKCDVYVDLKKLLFQLPNAKVVVKRLSKSVLENFLTRYVTAVTRVIHANTIVELQCCKSKDDAIKSIESCCTTCRKRVTLEELRKDCATCKRRLSFNCLRCNVEKLNYKLMLSHVRDRTMFYCSKCGFFTSKSCELSKHAENVHKKKLAFQCQRCSKTLKKFGGLRNHEKYCGKEAKICCALCGRKYKFAADLEQHAKKMHLKTE